MEIHLVTGKGGVGKSVVAAAMARAFAESGKRTLLAELGSQSFLQFFLGLQGPPVSHIPQRISSRVDLCLWTGDSCLREYALHLLKFEKVVNLFFENSVSKTLIDVAPGLAELALTGKITSGAPRNIGPKMDYDCLVVDAYATGHFLSLLRAPLGMSQTFKLGPMHEQSKGILQVLQNTKTTHLHIVTLPEELPAQESLELDQNLQKLLRQKANLWINQWISFPAGLRADSPLLYERDFFAKNNRQNQVLDLMGPVFQNRLSQLPFLFENDEQRMLESLSLAIQEKLSDRGLL